MTIRRLLSRSAFLSALVLSTASAWAADTDADGIDAGDNCPTTFNPLQADCNSDGAGDACQAAAGAAFTDADQDGICQAVDNCTTFANANQADCNNNGTGDMCEGATADRDDDGDGVCNALDPCPRETGACAMQAITVPWVPANPSIPHPTYSGANHTVKGIARYGANQYMWDFGDGTASTAWTPIADSNNLGVNHVYNGAVGQLFIATLSVRNSSNLNNVATATYRVKIGDSGPLPAAAPYAMDPNKMDVRVDMAIDQGLWYLHTTMNRATYGDGVPGYAQPYGYWNGVVAGTCTALDAFLLHGSKPNKDYATDPYVESAQRVLNYLLASYTVANGISPQTAGKPDYNLNGIGLLMGPTNDGHATYTLGICGVAFASSGTPTRQSLVGVDSNIRGRTYKQLAQDMAEYFAFGQADSGTQRGGWWYNANQGADGSTNQWPILAIAAAEDNMGIKTPAFVRTEAPFFMTHSRHTALDNRHGGWGYQNPNDAYVNHAKTAGGMLYHYFQGDSPAHPNVKAALGYLYRNWSRQNYDGGGAWNVGLGNSYAMYGVMKSMRVPQPNILRITEYDYNAGQQTANSFDWFYTPPGQSQEGLATNLVRRQQASGMWTDTIGNNIQTGAFATGWDVLILSKGVTTIPPEAEICDCTLTWDKNQNITLDGSCSNHPDLNRAIVSYEWDFDYNVTQFDVDATGVQGTKVGGYNFYGNHPVALRVTDNNPIALGGAQSTIATCTIVTKPPNNCPHPDAGGPYLGRHTIPVPLDARTSSDPDGDPITFAWDFDNDGQFDDAVGAQPSITYANPGTYSIAVQVTDARVDGLLPCSRVAFTTVEIGNAAPVANPGGPYQGVPGQQVMLIGTGSSDPDGDAISFGWDLNNDGVFVDSAQITPIFSIPANAAVGTVYSVCLKVTDAHGRVSAPACTTVTVLHVNTPPTCTAPAPAIVGECNGGMVTLVVDGISSADADGDPLTYAWSTTCPAGTFANRNAAMTTLTLNSAGGGCAAAPCLATLTISDGQATAACNRQINIIDKTAPTFTASPANVTIECNGDAAAAVDAWLGSASATDSCTAASLANDFDQVAGGCGGATGATNVTWTATDTCLNDTQHSATLTIVDSTAPVVSCPAATTLECTGEQTAVALSATASDGCAGERPATGPNAATYPVGVTAVAFQSSDTCGNTGACTSSVSITDLTAPALSCPANIAVECNAAGAANGVDGGTATATDLCSNATVTSNAPVGGTYPLGVTTTTHTAEDGHGNVVTCASTVTVGDSGLPSVVCPADVTVECNAATAATGVNAGQATASDVCSAVTVTDPAVGTYPLGINAATHSARDAAGNATSCANLITVVDTIRPTLSCPANVTVECNAPSSATGVSAGQATATDVCSAVAVTDPAAGTYALGANTATHSALDAENNPASCTNTVTVIDTTAPVFDAASLGPRNVSGDCSANPVAFVKPTATDAAGCQAVTVTCGTVAGNSVGANTVSCTATDLSGNSTSTTITVNILSPYRLGFTSLGDDNVMDNPETDADKINLFKSGGLIPHTLRVYDCTGADVSSTVGATLTLRLTVRLRSGTAGVPDTEIVPEYTGQGDAGGVFAYTGTLFRYTLNTNSTDYPVGTINTAAYFTSLVTATYNTQPGVVVAQEDARLESNNKGK